MIGGDKEINTLLSSTTIFRYKKDYITEKECKMRRISRGPAENPSKNTKTTNRYNPSTGEKEPMIPDYKLYPTSKVSEFLDADLLKEIGNKAVNAYYSQPSRTVESEYRSRLVLIDNDTHYPLEIVVGMNHQQCTAVVCLAEEAPTNPNLIVDRPFSASNDDWQEFKDTFKESK